MNWMESTSFLGRTVYKNDKYKIVLGRFPLIGGYWSWRGYKFINGKYRFIADYAYYIFKTPDEFVSSIEYEYKRQCDIKEYEKAQWAKIKKRPL